jgi:hypothetical protein
MHLVTTANEWSLIGILSSSIILLTLALGLRALLRKA